MAQTQTPRAEDISRADSFPASGADPIRGVVLLHGFAGWPGLMWPLARSLSREGYRPFLPFYPSWRWPLDRIVGHLASRVERFTEEVGGPVHFVGHSMGGLVARALIQRQRPATLSRVVMLGTPNAGSEIADMLTRYRVSRFILGQAEAALITRRDRRLIEMLGSVDYPVGVIAGSRPFLHTPVSSSLPRPHDGKVSVAATHVEGETAHIVLPLSHAVLPYHPRAQAQVRAFLSSGEFDESP